MRDVPPTSETDPQSPPPVEAPYRLPGPRRKVFVRCVIALALLVYVLAVWLTRHLSPGRPLPNAIVAVKWDHGPADARARLEGINGTRLDKPVEAGFDPSEEYVCRLHVYKGWYRLTVTRGAAVYYEQEFPLDEFSQRNIALTPLPPPSAQEPELSD